MSSNREVFITRKAFRVKDWITKVIESGDRFAMPVMTYPAVNLTGKKILDVVKNGENGLIVEPRDPIDLARAIEELIVDPDRRKIMGIRGRVIVENHYAEEKIIDKTF